MFRKKVPYEQPIDDKKLLSLDFRQYMDITLVVQLNVPKYPYMLDLSFNPESLKCNPFCMVTPVAACNNTTNNIDIVI